MPLECKSDALLLLSVLSVEIVDYDYSDLLLYSLWCGIAERISEHLFTVAKRI
jgi:hypothetical protein